MSKYKNIKTRGFASKKEAARNTDLRLLERAGEITDLRQQVRYTFDQLRYPSGRKPSYIADFTYTTREGEFVCEDTKGYSTPLYKLKFALMQYFHNITVLET